MDITTTTEARSDGRVHAFRFKAWACHVDVYALDRGNGVFTDAVIELDENVYVLPSSAEARELSDALVMAAAYADHINGEVKAEKINA